MPAKRSTPLPPVTVTCEQCGAAFLRYQSEIRKNPSGRLFCSRTCATTGATSPLSRPGVYAVTHTPSGRLYIGSSADMTRRWGYHRSAIRVGRHENDPLQALGIADGMASLSITVLEYVESGKLIEAEQRWLDHYRPSGLLLNLAPNAGSTVGTPVRAEVRERHRINSTGRVNSAATRAKISAAHMGKKIGRMTFGKERRRLSDDEAAVVKRLLADGTSANKAARDLDVPQHVTVRIARGELYLDVCPELNEAIAANRPNGKSRDQTARAKIRTPDIAVILSRLDRGDTVTDIATDYHVTRGLIYQLRQRSHH